MSLKPPPFDPELELVLAVVAGQESGALTLEKIVEQRAAYAAAMPSNEELGANGAFHIEEHTAPGTDGTPDVPLLVCRPADATGPSPAVYYMHPGGMVMGTNRFNVEYLLDWVAELGVTLVSVEYRLAPENPYPAALEDCYAGLRWTADHADDIGVDPERVIVAGTSGGGGLAAALTLFSRDRGGPRPLGQILMCPMIDDRGDTVSARQMSGLGLWNRATNETAWHHVLGEKRGGEDVSPYAAPARADDLSGLPPAFLDVGSAETFRDEVVDYASRIWQAGGAAELHVWPGGFHGFDLLAPQAALSRDARAARLRWLRRILDT